MVTLQRPTTAIKTNSTTLADKRKNHKNLSLNLTSRRIQPPATTTPAAATPAAIRKAACDNDDNPPSQEPQHLTHYEQGPAQILPNLFLGACHTAQNSAVLERHDISCIINVAHEINSPAPSVSSYHHFKWTHSQNNLARREFQRAIRILENAHRSNVNVLVHCQSGVERSASLVIAYILYLSRNNPLSSVVTKQMSLSEAYDFVRIRAPAIKPNMELMYQLNEFELIMFPKTAAVSRARSRSVHHQQQQHHHHHYTNNSNNHLQHHHRQYPTSTIATSPKQQQQQQHYHHRLRRRAASSASSSSAAPPPPSHPQHLQYLRRNNNNNNSNLNCNTSIKEHQHQRQQLALPSPVLATIPLTPGPCTAAATTTTATTTTTTTAGAPRTPSFSSSSCSSKVVITTKPAPVFPGDEVHIVLIVIVAISYIVMVTRHSSNTINDNNSTADAITSAARIAGEQYNRLLPQQQQQQQQQRKAIPKPIATTASSGGGGRTLERRASWIGEPPSTPFSPLFLHRLFPIY